MNTWLREQYWCFCLALAFFTRIPVPATTPYSPERLNHASRYFAVVGMLVGVLTAASVWFFALWLPLPVALLLALLCSLCLTGAFHEDGLADMADGLGGGMTVERKLTIMKDSRLGTYGACALLIALLLKWQSQLVLGTGQLPALFACMIVLHTWSRAMAASLLFDTPYVRDVDGKSKPLANNQTRSDCLVLLGSGLLPFCLLSPWPAGSLLAITLLIRHLARRLFIRQLGGYTGDCLGGCQQMVELGGYIILLAWQQHGGDLLAPWLLHVR